MAANVMNQTTGSDVPAIHFNVSSKPDEDFDRFLKIGIPTLYSLIFLVGLIGNSLVVAVVVVDRAMRNMTNILRAGLALADLLFIVGCIPYEAVKFVVDGWPFGDGFCKVIYYIEFASAYISAYTIVWMSFVRYLVVAHPYSSFKFCKPRVAYIIILVTWTIMLIANIPVPLNYSVLVYRYGNKEKTACHTSNSYFSKPGRFISTTFFVCGYFVPILIIFVMYGLLLRRLSIRDVGRKTSARRINSNKRATRTVVIVVVTFLLCWLPDHLKNLHFYWFPGHPFHRKKTFAVLALTSNVLAYMNSCVNPLIYAFISDHFRRSFIEVIKRENNRRRPSRTEQMSI